MLLPRERNVLILAEPLSRSDTWFRSLARSVTRVRMTAGVCGDRMITG